jgi:hypothetical protein
MSLWYTNEMKYRPPKFNKMDREIQWEIYNVLADYDAGYVPTFEDQMYDDGRIDKEAMTAYIKQLSRYLKAQEDEIDRLEEIAEEARKTLNGDDIAKAYLDKLLWERGL